MKEESAELQARKIALKTLFDGYVVLLACRDLVRLRGRLPSVPVSLMDTFVAIESEVEDLPIGAERRHWAEYALREKDARAAAYREQVRVLVLQDLQELLAVLDGGGMSESS